VQPYYDIVKSDINKKMIITNITEGFTTNIRVAIYSALFISIPVFFTNIYLFLAPALYKQEKNNVLLYILTAVFLFFFGSLFAYFFIFPNAWKFLVSFEFTNNILPVSFELKISDYLSIVINSLILFGIVFQIPIMLTLFHKFDFINVKSMKKNRKYVIVGIFIVAAIVTPPDIISQILLAIPIILFYEISILICNRKEKVK